LTIQSAGAARSLQRLIVAQLNDTQAKVREIEGELRWHRGNSVSRLLATISPASASSAQVRLQQRSPTRACSGRGANLRHGRVCTAPVRAASRSGYEVSNAVTSTSAVFWSRARSRSFAALARMEASPGLCGRPPTEAGSPVHNSLQCSLLTSLASPLPCVIFTLTTMSLARAVSLSPLRRLNCSLWAI